MRTTHIAHLGTDRNQLLGEHLLGVSRRGLAYASAFGLGRAGELIGLMHDLGKATDEFQEYLLSFSADSDSEPRDDLRGKVDHSTAGAHWIHDHLGDTADPSSPASIVAHVLALCVASHHSGLIDCLTLDGRDELMRRLAKSKARHDRLNEAWEGVDSTIRKQAEELMRDDRLLREFHDAFSRFKPGRGDLNLQFGLLVRFLFSCLIDADRTDTANFEKPASARLRQESRYTSWTILLSRLEKAIAQMDSTSHVNRCRSRISEACFNAAARVPGIYTLTVPTGGGKTLSALRYALEHARLHGMERVIFVSPFISIVDQNASVARSILEPEGTAYASVVLEHHSNLAQETDEKPTPAEWRRRILVENWDAPVVFTTSVQVLEALFGGGTRSVRRLHAMAKAVVVFDEVQTLPIRMVHLFNNAINFLVSHCNSSILLCTATQPLLDEVDEQKGRVQLGYPPQLIADVQSLFSDFKRYQVFDHTDQPGGWTLEQVASLVRQEAQSHGSCLAIVNTKRDAKGLFEQLRGCADDPSQVVHLSTGMCPAHRLAALKALKKQLPHSSPTKPFICVSTQLIEAGVDIDFATVVRDLAGLDSIAQAAGRCNRHGLRSEPGRVHIVELPEPPKQLADIRKGRTAARELLGEWRRQFPGVPFPLDDPKQMDQYYERSFYRRKDEMSFSVQATKVGRDTTLLELLGSNRTALAAARRSSQLPMRPVLLQSFRTAADEFELIAETKGFVVPYGPGGKEMLNALSASFDLDREWQLLRKAQQFTVSVYEAQFKKMIDKGFLYEAKRNSGVYCLRAQFYDQEYGLRTEAGLMEDLSV